MRRARASGGLAPWQEKRVKEILAANLDGNISPRTLAKECQLSISHFSRAFKQTTGTSPHQWLLSQRIESAKQKLRNKELSLSEIALSCGFADQSHFTKVFTSREGLSPARWQRSFL